MIKRVSLTFGYPERDNRPEARNDDESSTNSSDDSTTIGVAKSQESLNAPIVWERTTTGYRIIDLRPDRISRALDLLNSHFFVEEPTSIATSLSNDPVSLKSYRKFARKCFLQGNSFCAIREGIGGLAGVAIMSIRRKTDSDNRDIQGTALSVVTALEKHLFTEAQLENKLADLEEYFRVDVLCVKPEHRGKGVASSLLRSCVAKTRSLNVSACIGVFSSDTSQRIAGRLGFKKLGEIPYATYIEKYNRDNTFVHLGTENHTLACMAMRNFLGTPSTHRDMTISTSVTKKSKKSVATM